MFITNKIKYENHLKINLLIILLLILTQLCRHWKVLDALNDIFSCQCCHFSSCLQSGWSNMRDQDTVFQFGHWMISWQWFWSHNIKSSHGNFLGLQSFNKVILIDHTLNMKENLSNKWFHVKSEWHKIIKFSKVWKFHNFSITNILREINFWDF